MNLERSTTASSGDTHAERRLLEVSGLKVLLGGTSSLWPKRSGHPAVDGVSFVVNRGQTMGLIGESGSGKTTVCKVLAGLVRPTAGQALLEGQDLLAGPRHGRALTRRVQMIFQDPFASLDPGIRVLELVREPLRVHRLGTRREQRERVNELLELVGLNSAFLTRYPHQMSGGQLQRVAIARALALNPDLLLADEPLSALDVSIQAQVSNLLMRLQKELGISFLFIGHDLAAVRRLSDSVAVMYGGRIMERGTAEEVYGAPRHPYTVALMSAVPQPTTMAAQQTRIKVRTQSEGISGGCRYRERCWLYESLGQPSACRSEEPEIVPEQGQRGAACHFSDQIISQPEYGQVLAGAELA